jgi:Ca2+-binding EF-hand superfamily protein
MNNIATIRLFCNARFARWIGFSIVAVLMLGAAAEAQQFKLEDYLKRKDVNRNGRVEPEEMSDNTRGFLKKMGFDSDKSISISKIVSKANNDRKEATAKATQKNRVRKVPGFGVEKTTESGVSRFGASDSKSSSSSKSKYSDGVMKQVSDTLGRYDRNKDGSLDRDELRKARWGSPPPEQSDTNKDGRLTRDELAKRYASREQYYRSSRTSSSSSSSRSDRERELAKRKEAEDRARREKERARYRSTSSSTSSRSSYRPTSSSSRSTSSSSRPSSSSSSSGSQEKYEKYAESLISQYDQDKDGKLSKDETKKMRRPPAGADADKDGFITKSEMVGSLSGTNKATVSAKSEKSNDKDGKSSTRSSRDRGSYTRSSSSRPGSSTSFEKLDVDADRHVQMHEYATKWDDKTVEEFYEKDKNGDGVITLREWTGKN